MVSIDAPKIGDVVNHCRAQRLDRWCAANGRPEAIVAGFFVRDPWRPLGEVRVGGELIAHEPIAEPFGPARSCVLVEPDGAVVLAPRGEITAERHPRCALGVNEDELIAVCCDGRRTGVDAGLELAELARLLVSLGATDAVNLDGGGSATLVHCGHLLNRPYSSVDQPGPESRPVVTALLFDSLPRD